MRYEPIDPQLFIHNRARFTADMQPNSVAFFVSNDQFPRNADANFYFRQNSELFWLTGIDQEDTFLMLYPDCPNPRFREVLFILETNDHIAVWEGHKYSQAEAAAMSGITTVLWNKEFRSTLNTYMKYADVCYLNTNENDRASNPLATAELRFARELQQQFPLHTYKRAAKIMEQHRSRKHALEVELIKRAIHITAGGFHEVLKMVKSGTWEFEIEGTILKHFLSNRANGFSFEPIIASGASACVLHYVKNDKQCKDGDLMLLDFGADYANYAGDMTRCFPVNGRFSKRQKEVYDAVLRVNYAATKLLVPGRTLDEYNREAALIMQDELLSLGLITRDDIAKENPHWPAYKKYFPHGTGHFLGIDVHDIGARYGKLDEGMVITCEPGIYIAEEGLGIRIENDILITKNGPVNLMAGIPIETEEIEEVMLAGK
ncbi:MAG: aminopeptidase P family protein [Sphingobacteriaceae bacterium]|nr:aminopeptidase P family protein [Sphingobacteriaceae bacterium]